MNSTHPSFAKVLAVEMGGRGYSPFPVVTPFKSLFAFSKAINAEISCFVYFRYMPARKAYDVAVGVESIQLQPTVEAAIERFSSLSGGLAYSAENSPTARLLFNPDVYTRETVGNTLSAKVDHIHPYLESLFSHAIQPVFEVVADKKNLLALLLRSDPPFNQAYLSRRIFFIIALVWETKAQWEPVRKILQEKEAFFRNDAYVGNYAGPLIDDIYSYLLFLKRELE